MSLNLKHLSCPAGSNCKAFKCIFGHPEDDNNKKSRPAEETPSNEGPRKRPKRDEGENLRRESFDAGVESRSAAKNDEPVTRLASPLTVARTSTYKKLPPAKSLEPRVTSISKRPQKQEKKVESLNPRLLKNSPASHEIRLKLLRMLHTEYERLNSELEKDANDEEKGLVLSGPELVSKALDEEEQTALQKAAVYTNVMKNKVTSYRRKSIGQWKTERENEIKLTQGGPSTSNSTHDGSKKIETGLAPAQEVEVLQHILTPIESLSQHGYVSKVPLEDSISVAHESMRSTKGWENCERCRQRFQVFPGRRELDGALTSRGPCQFHWGKTYIAEKAPGNSSRSPKRYQCCGQEVGESPGCYTHDQHVYKVNDPARLAAVVNFAETPKNDLAPLDRAVCFDCEMGYTVHGMELVRLTATSWPSGEELLDVLVQPLGEILDLNSRFSGVWPDDLALAEPWGDDDDDDDDDVKRVSPLGGLDKAADADVEDQEGKPATKKLKKVSSPEAARKLLFSLISPTTPLIGHGLENDLNSVRIVHPTLIDTVLLYPHKGGLPFRNGLKKLMDLHLNRKIQQEVGPKMLGHDSAEDARAAGELVRLRVMEQWKAMKREGWKLNEEGLIQPPPRQELTEEFIES